MFLKLTVEWEDLPVEAAVASVTEARKISVSYDSIARIRLSGNLTCSIGELASFTRPEPAQAIAVCLEQGWETCIRRPSLLQSPCTAAALQVSGHSYSDTASPRTFLGLPKALIIVTKR